MNVKETHLGDVTVHQVTLTFEVTSEDYSSELNKRLNDYRKNADFKGFRKGNAPKELIQKIYGAQTLNSVVEKVVMGSVREYLKEHKMALEAQAELVQYPESWPIGESGTVILKLRMIDAPEEAESEE